YRVTIKEVVSHTALSVARHLNRDIQNHWTLCYSPIFFLYVDSRLDIYREVLEAITDSYNNSGDGCKYIFHPLPERVSESFLKTWFLAHLTLPTFSVSLISMYQSLSRQPPLILIESIL